MTNLSFDRRSPSDYSLESWDDFGNNIQRYIYLHEKELAEKSYDVILGFSRDGAMLAFVFSCLLKDILVNPYSKKSKASVRPIPRDITVEETDPCITDDQILTSMEKQDILDCLEKDLAAFSGTYNNEKPINVLIMDTRSAITSRTKFLMEELNNMGCIIKNCDLITYDKLRRKEHSTMPWHANLEKESITASSGRYIESWRHFGENLVKYIHEHEIELNEKSYDVILGFSRGGVVLAYAFSTLLKEISIPVYSIKSKASVRPIPIGVTVKESDPCFVMDQPSTPLETRDIAEQLKIDLSEFSKKYNDNQPIKVLIMDDNLTGATRLKSLKDELRKMDCVSYHETLAYVRHNKFKEIKTIIKYPDDIDYFVMPWHVDHGKKDLDIPSEENDLKEFKFYIRLYNEFDNFKINLKNLENRTGKPFVFAENLITNSAKTIGFHLEYLQEGNSKFIELSYTLFMFYPPKKCLLPMNSSRDENNGRFHPLCSYDLDGPMKPLSIGVCLICSCLNCNKRIIKCMMTAGGKTISFVARSSKINNSRLEQAIRKWFEESMSEIVLDNYE